MNTPARPGRLWLLLSLAALAAAAAATLAAWRHVTRPGYRFDRGREALARGDHAAALAHADALEGAGEPERAGLLRAESLLLRDKPGEGYAALATLDPHGPHGVAAIVLAARCQAALGMPREAARNFNAALARDPDSADAHRGLAALHYDLGVLGGAIRHLEAVMRLDPADGRSSRLAGLIYMDLADHAAAEGAYRAALAAKLQPAARLQARRELASSLIHLTRFGEALEELDRADKEGAGPSPIGAFLRAQALGRLGRQGEALVLLGRAVVEFPDDAQLWFLRGQLLLQLKRPSEAVSDLEQAVSLAPSDHQSLFHLAQAQEALGRDADAARTRARTEEVAKLLDRLTELTKEAGKKPFDPSVRVKLGEMADKLGNRKLAKMWYNAARSLEPKRK